jgi:uncharacterized membrane protein YcaP (DUF421 family)
MNDFLLVFLRIISIIPLLFLMTLIMGKRQVGELPVFDFIIAVTIGSVVGADIADPEVRHAPTAFAVVVLAAFQVAVSVGIIKNRIFGHLLSLEPTIVIQNGQLLKSHLKRIRYPIDTVLELLREKGVFNLNEVEFAIIEPDGKLSVLKKSQHLPVTAKDISLQTAYKGIPIPLIVEGKVYHKGLNNAGLKEEWLINKLLEQNITSSKEVFFASLNSDGSLHISLAAEPKQEQVFRF